MPVLARTANGTLMGMRHQGCNIFKGIPYGRAKRFRAPEAVDPWPGIRSALIYGEVCPNANQGMRVMDFGTPAGTDLPQSENCLFLNVWTPSMDPGSKLPVLFWIHGGGWWDGASNELVYYDGQNFSTRQNVVFVSINHRLNVLGYTDLSAYGDAYRNSGNAGVADMVKALGWVRENISAFGGDPDNVTIMGQSGGGSKVATLMSLPCARGLFHKAAVFSGMLSAIPRENARAAGKALVEKAKQVYGLAADREALEKLESMPYRELSALAADTGVGRAPVLDEAYYPQLLPDSPLGAGIPLLISNSLGEMNSNLAGLTVAPMIQGISSGLPSPEAYLPLFCKPLMTPGIVEEKLRQRFGARAAQAVAAFHAAYPGHDDVDAAFVDNSILTTDTLKIGLSHIGKGPVYRCMFAYELPLFGGVANYHTGGDIPFVLDNLDKIGYLLAGDEDCAGQIGRKASDALGAFVRSGNPGWPAFTEENRETMVFDRVSQVRCNHDTLLRSFLPEDQMPF